MGICGLFLEVWVNWANTVGGDDGTAWMTSFVGEDCDGAKGEEVAFSVGRLVQHKVKWL